MATKIPAPVRARFSDAPWFRELDEELVLVLGAGGIGSWVTFCLNRIGCVVHVYDDDTIEMHNVGGQMYGPNSMGELKVDALSSICEQLTGLVYTRIIPHAERYIESSYISPIVIAAFDNMASRKLAFEKWAAQGDRAIFIDGRLLAEDYHVFAVTKGREEEYRKTLFDDKSVSAENCSLKATTHCSMGIASDIVAVLTNFAANRATMEEFGELRDVPFRISKSIPLFSYETTLENGNINGNTGNTSTGGRASEACQEAYQGAFLFE